MRLQQRLGLFCALLTAAGVLHAQIKSPAEFLPSAYEKSFTFHHDVVSYVQYVADQSDYVDVVEYGRTEEGRPLLLCFISDPENLKNLETIRQNHLKSIFEDKTQTESHAIVWLSFGVHGNEAGGTESSMLALYRLASHQGKVGEWLKNTVIILDPCLNPDGFSRYTNWARMVEKKELYVDPDDDEHHEPWPNGRYNHYLFDLNRDWVWQTQVESQKRLEKYRSWMPHVHGDFHEMNYNNHYYFPPAAKPYHPFLSTFQKDFQGQFGENNARYFDQNDWLYFTGEEFDLFYPSYGDTYPMFNGAIGMTFEQAGHSMAGRAILTRSGDTLKLSDRIQHHAVVALSTVEVAAKQSQKLINEQKVYFENNRSNPKGKFKSYVMKQGANIPELVKLLQRNGIEYEVLTADIAKKQTGYQYQSRKIQAFVAEKGDLVVQAHQNNSTLAQILLDPAYEIEDSLTYDITAWSLPYVYNLETYGTAETFRIPAQGPENAIIENADGKDALGVLVPWDGLQTGKMAAYLFNHGLQLQRSIRPTVWDKDTVSAGSVFIWRKDQDNWTSKLDLLTKYLQKEKLPHQFLSSTYSKAGNDAGGSSFEAIQKPAVLALKGSDVSVFDYGQTIYYFEKVLGLPVSSVDIHRFSGLNLTKYNLIILPSGSYAISDDFKNKLSKWVQQGGKLIVLGSACEKLADKQAFGIRKKAAGTAAEADTSEQLKFSDLERKMVSSYVPGAIVKTHIDGSHPLAYGLHDPYYMMVLDNSFYAGGKELWPVAQTTSPLVYEGFIGSDAKSSLEKSDLLMAEKMGRGSILYFPSNPLFRGFWYSGHHLMANAVFQF